MSGSMLAMSWCMLAMSVGVLAMSGSMLAMSGSMLAMSGIMLAMSGSMLAMSGSMLAIRIYDTEWYSLKKRKEIMHWIESTLGIFWYCKMESDTVDLIMKIIDGGLTVNGIVCIRSWYV